MCIADLAPGEPLLEGQVEADEREREADRRTGVSGVLGGVRVDRELVVAAEADDVLELVAGHLAIQLPAGCRGVAAGVDRAGGLCTGQLEAASRADAPAGGRWVVHAADDRTSAGNSARLLSGADILRG